MSSMTAKEFVNYFYNPRQQRQLSEENNELDDLSKYFLQLSGLQYNPDEDQIGTTGILQLQKRIKEGQEITNIAYDDQTGQRIITIGGQNIEIPEEDYQKVVSAQTQREQLLEDVLKPKPSITRTSEISIPRSIPLAEPQTKPSALQVKDLEDLYDFYGLEGEERTFSNLEAKHDAATNIGSRAMGYGPITKKVEQVYRARGKRLLEEINKLEGKDSLTPIEQQRLQELNTLYENNYETFPQLQPQPLQAIDAAIRKRAHSPIIEPERQRIQQQELEEQREVEKELESPLANAVELAQGTKKEETVANVLNKTLTTPIEVMKSQGSIQPGQNANISTDKMKEEVFDSNSEDSKIDGKSFDIEVTTPSTGNEKIIVDGEYRYVLNREERKLSIQKRQTDGSYKEVMNEVDWAKLPPNQKDKVIQNVAKAEKKQDDSNIIVEKIPSIMSEAIGMTGRYDDYTGDTLESIPKRQESLVDGDYIYYYEDGLPIRIEDSQGNPYDINEEAEQVMLEKLDAKRKEEQILREQGQPAIEQIVEESTPTQTNLEDVSEAIATEEPEKLKQLGQKAKQNFQGLGDEQKAMMGLMGLEVLSEGVNYSGPARKEARDRIEILEGRRERGQLGVDERQDAETMKYMTRPVRALAEESEREQQAVMAGMGETRSAADLRRLRESRDAQMTDALSRAGQEVARQQMARKEMEKRELNQLQAYEQQNLRNLTNRITGAAANMAQTFGANVAAEADIQRELSPESIEKYMKILKEANPDLSESDLRRKAVDYGLAKARSKLFTGI